MSSPKDRARTISPDAKKDPQEPTSPIKSARTAGVFLPTPEPARPLFEVEKPIQDSEIFDDDDVPSLEIVETPEIRTWTTTAATTAGEYSRAMTKWYQEDPVCQKYAGFKNWEDMTLNSFLLKDDFPGQWNPGSPLFDVEASFGTMGHCLGTGLYFRRLFLNPQLSEVRAPLFFLRQFQGQEFVEFPMVTGCVDDVVAFGGLEAVGAFTAWLSVIPVHPVPVNTTLLAKMSCREVPVEPGKKASKSKKMMISMAIVHPDFPATKVYVRAEGLLVRPAEGGMDMRRYDMYGPIRSSEVLWGTKEVEDRAEAIVREQLEEGGEAGPGNLEAARAQRAESMSLLKDETTGADVLVRARNPENLEAQWLKTHPIFQKIPELLCAPADPLAGGEYLSGLAMMRFSHHPRQRVQEEGKCCVVGAVHFLPPVEGPPGLAHGGSIYGIFEHLFGQALKSPTLAAELATRTTPRTRTSTNTTTTTTTGTGASTTVTTTSTTTTTATGIGMARGLEDQGDSEALVLKVQYKGQLPLNNTYFLECRISEPEDAEGGATRRMLRGSLRSLDGQTVYNSAEAVLPETFCVAPAHRSRL